MFVSFAIKPLLLFASSKASCTSGPRALKGFEIYLSINLLYAFSKVPGSPVIALPVPVWFLNLDTVLPAAPMAPVNNAPSTPNFNLFNNSVVGSLVSLSTFVGPPRKSPKVPTSSTSPTNTPSATPPATAPLPNLLNFSLALKYLPACFALKVAFVKPDPILNAAPPGIPILTISSVILPAAVASAASSKGFILSKYSSTASALFLSTPRSISVAPKVAAPSNILNTPEPNPANIDLVKPTSLSLVASEDPPPNIFSYSA